MIVPDGYSTFGAPARPGTPPRAAFLRVAAAQSDFLAAARKATVTVCLALGADHPREIDESDPDVVWLRVPPFTRHLRWAALGTARAIDDDRPRTYVQRFELDGASDYEAYEHAVSVEGDLEDDELAGTGVWFGEGVPTADGQAEYIDLGAPVAVEQEVGLLVWSTTPIHGVAFEAVREVEV